jgi:hypothetical protein
MSLVSMLDRLEDEHFSDLKPSRIRDVLGELAAAPSEEVMGKEIKAMSAAQQDTLMKVIYVALSTDTGKSALYFKWHAAVYAQCGSGVVVRTITDKPIMPPSIDE